MEINHRSYESKLYDNPNDYFDLDGNAAMFLSEAAAVLVCKAAAARGGFVLAVEGGRYKKPYFEARYDCIWNSVGTQPQSKKHKIENNEAAAAFVSNALRDFGCNAFVLTMEF